MRLTLRFILGLILWSAVTPLRSAPPQEKTESSSSLHTMNMDASLANEAAIRKLIDGFVAAVRAKDLNGIEAVFSRDIISYDFAPPLQERGAETFFKRWRELLDTFQGPIEFETRELSITAGSDVAFSHTLNRMAGITKRGQKIDRWLRWTACYRKIDGKWLIVHEHVSVPADAKTGKAALDLKP